jgi:hypothetical protein
MRGTAGIVLFSRAVRNAGTRTGTRLSAGTGATAAPGWKLELTGLPLHLD